MLRQGKSADGSSEATTNPDRWARRSHEMAMEATTNIGAT